MSNDEQYDQISNQLEKFRLNPKQYEVKTNVIPLNFGKVSVIPQKANLSLNISHFVFGKENLDQMENSISKNMEEVLKVLDDIEGGGGNSPKETSKIENKKIS